MKVAGEGGRCGTIILTRYCAFLFLIFVFVLVSIYTCISIFVSIGICICETSELKVAAEERGVRRCGTIILTRHCAAFLMSPSHTELGRVEKTKLYSIGPF